jgi:ankyrin repeat protein
VNGGADLNVVTDEGESALSQAIKLENNLLSDFLMRKGANIFNQDMLHRNTSPFFQAIDTQNLFALEIFCDHDADLTLENSDGQTPLIYSALNGYDEICMYLTLRYPNIDEAHEKGKNVFFIYLER